ncbi:hypothetical protein HWV62_36023 [Athelia sp. TMB]|nr:hypothetical protein HWV62_36023 [Athelia sp. TMB]
MLAIEDDASPTIRKRLLVSVTERMRKRAARRTATSRPSPSAATPTASSTSSTSAPPSSPATSPTSPLTPSTPLPSARASTSTGSPLRAHLQHRPFAQQSPSARTRSSRTCPPGALGAGVLGTGVGEGNGTGPREVGVFEGARVLSDPDWDDNLERTLESLGVPRGKFLTIVDEEGEWGTIAVGLGVLPPNHPVDAPPFILPSPLPLPPRKERPATPPPPPAPSKKRAGPDDDEIVEVEPSSKRTKMNGSSAPALSSPSKKRRLEEDGLILMESAEDRLRDDIIEID